MTSPAWLKKEEMAEPMNDGWGDKDAVIMKSTIVTVAPDHLQALPDQNGFQHAQETDIAPADSQAAMQQKLERMWAQQQKEQQQRELQLQLQMQQQQQQREEEERILYWNGKESGQKQRPTAFLRHAFNQQQENSGPQNGTTATANAEHLSEEELSGIASMVQALVSEKAELLKLLQKKEDEVDTLHQLLWYSEVAPSHGELTELLMHSVVSSYSMAEPEAEKLRNEQARLQQVVEDLHKQLVSNNIQPQYSTDKPESMTNRLLSLEQQLINYAKIIRKQQMQLNDQLKLSAHSPSSRSGPRPAASSAPPMTPADAHAHAPAVAPGGDAGGESAEELRARLVQKEGMVVQLDHALVMREMEADALQQSLAMRDAVLSRRQADISAKDDELARLRSALDHRDRELSTVKDQLRALGHAPLPPSALSPDALAASAPPATASARHLISARARQVNLLPTAVQTPASSSPTVAPASNSSEASGPRPPSHRASQPPPSSPDAGTLEALGAWDSARAEVREQLSRMTRSRMALYSPRPSSTPLSLFNPPAGSRKMARLRPAPVQENGETENAIVTL